MALGECRVANAVDISRDMDGRQGAATIERFALNRGHTLWDGHLGDSGWIRFYGSFDQSIAHFYLDHMVGRFHADALCNGRPVAPPQSVEWAVLAGDDDNRAI